MAEEKKQGVSRRDFLKISGAAAGLAAGGTLSASAVAGKAKSAPMGLMVKPAELPKAKGPRVIVVGGGWSGLTIAKYLKKEDPGLDVVLIEKNTMFMSCPLSSLWVTGTDPDDVDLEFLCHSYLDAARNNGYFFLNATVADVDRTSRKVYTDRGYVHYDFLVLSPGIDYNYASIGVTDPADQQYLWTHYPAGFIPGSEHISLKEKLENFDGGVFVQTVPTGNYRCLPGPYERACLIADYFKREGIKGKVLVLDANPDITIKKKGFEAAFNELYKGIIERIGSVEITSVDLAKKTLNTEFDSYKFDDASIYPRVRASKLIEALGLVNPESPQMEANIDPFHYNIKGDKRVYVAGDSRPMPFSKSGNTANSEGKIVAKIIAARAKGKEVKWQSPHTICYSFVQGEPLEAIGVDAYYSYNPKDGSFSFARVKLFEERSPALAQAGLEWARGMFRDMFS
ncbi:MAG: NAD(P)/FAD-dependent oxidoreductase [Gammaproteobacteria bacterium]|nr:MAG: NAD(P)/FAD-dependent oxidoreductase [Gammaproteobacteria bacterium]